MSTANIVPGFPLTGVSPDSISFFKRLITWPSSVPSNPRETLYANLIDGLKTAGIALDCLFVFAAADFMTCCVDLVSNRVANWPLGFGVFTADQGVSPQGSSAYLDLMFNPSTDGVNFQRDNASCFFWLLGTQNTPTNVLGNTSGILAVTLSVNAGHLNWKMNDHADGGIAGNDAGAGSITDGFYLLNRPSSSATALYENGSQVAAVSQASAEIPNGKPNLSSNNQFTVAILGFGASLPGDQITTLCNLCQTYLHAIGAV